jgi:hypothetical protein
LIIIPRELHRTRRFIRTKHLHGDEEIKKRSSDVPLPELGKSLDALVPVLCSILQVPSDWGSDVRITGVAFGDLRDAQTVMIHAQKPLTLSGKLLPVHVPPVLLGTPNTEGAVTQPLPKEHVEVVETCREQVREYVIGKRAQGTLPLEVDDASDDESSEPTATSQGDLIQMPAGSHGKPTRRKKAPAATAAGE